MGIGHKQQNFEYSPGKFRYNHGGLLRQKRRGRKARPLSTKQAIHLVFKADRRSLRRGFRSPLGFHICKSVIKRYSKRFFVKIDQAAICNDHIHLLVRFPRRAQGQYFLRVVAGQIAQQFENRGLKVTDTPEARAGSRKKGRSVWKYRPFSRVVVGFRAYRVCLAYVRLNRKEAQGKIVYKKLRLRGLSSGEWKILWE